MFLPDRYIKGECPKCGAKDQYGDACENCSSVYSPTDLRNPYSTLSGATPVLRSSEHYFFRLSDPACVAFLRAWALGERLQPEVANKAREWLGDDGKAMGDWDISRDEPYFGIPIPDLPPEAPAKYFYVWLDAPVGYLASLKAHLAKRGVDFAAFLADPTVEQVHFIGKDIVYHHTLFWPAMLEFAGAPYKVPDNVWVHGFITFSGEKMSKSRGTGISPDVYLDLGLDPEWLRYYLAAKLNGRVEDLDFNPDDFLARVNSDLVGKYVNIASRAAPFLTRHFDGRLGTPAESAAQRASRLATAQADADAARANYEAREYGRVMREAMRIADRLNEAFDAAQPWLLAKDRGQRDAAADHLLAVAAGLPPAQRAARPRAAAARLARGARALRPRPRLRVGGCGRRSRRRAAVQAPDAAHRSQADRRAARRTEGRRSGTGRRGHGRGEGRARRAAGRRRCCAGAPTRSPSTTSPRSTCASRASWTRSTSRGRTSSSGSRSTSARAGTAPCSRASSRPTGPRTSSAA